VRSRRTTLIVVAVIMIAFATVVVGTTLSAGDGGVTHTMPDGSSMQGDRMP
jgi:hypothetical protein